MQKVDIPYFASRFNIKNRPVVVTDTEYDGTAFIVSVGKPSPNCDVYVEEEICGVINACKPYLVHTDVKNCEVEKWCGLTGAKYTYNKEPEDFDNVVEDVLEEVFEDYDWNNVQERDNQDSTE